MLDLSELKQFVAFADLGTLSKAAEQLHISQPTITRTMQHIEEAFGLPLFCRNKNKITLNETGEKAVWYARNLLEYADNAIRQVQAFDKSLHTLTIESCAPAPLWSLLPSLSSVYPDMAMSASLKEVPEILEHLADGTCDIGICHYNIEGGSFVCLPYIKESLSICVRSDNELASKKNLTFAELNGYNFLLKSEIGFWDHLCREKMPSSKFLVQTDDFTFTELVKESSLPCFATNYTQDSANYLHGRVIIPVTDEEASVTFYLVTLEMKKHFLRNFM